MSVQASLFKGVDHRADAQEWIAENPEAFEIFCSRALAAWGAGAKVGAKCVWEVMRWSMEVRKQAGRAFACDNNHVAYVAREAARRHPELDGFFQERKVSS